MYITSVVPYYKVMFYNKFVLSHTLRKNKNYNSTIVALIKHVISLLGNTFKQLEGFKFGMIYTTINLKRKLNLKALSHTAW